MISVIIPLYNKECYIAQAVVSVLNQSYQDFEIVVIDDGSTDDSLNEAKKVANSRMRIISQVNAGVSAARNKGIKEARGEYVAFLDADDIWHKDFLQTIASLIVHYPEASVFATKYNKMRDAKTMDIVVRNLPFAGQDGILYNYFEVASCSEPPICSISITVRITAINEIGGFPIGIKAGEDLLTWARLAVKYPIAYSKKVMATYLLPDSLVAIQRPTRRQDDDDLVGITLGKLYDENKQVCGLKDYVALWHKMRAVNALGFLDLQETRKETLLALKYNWKSAKLYIMLILSFLPRFWVRSVYKSYVGRGGY